MSGRIFSRVALSAGTALQVLAIMGGGIAGSVVVATPAFAQDYTRGSLVGSVVTSDGKPVANATVTAKSNEQGFQQSTITNQDGSFNFNLLPTGSYTVRITSSGNATIEDKNVPVVAGQSNSFTFKASAAEQAASGDEIIVTGARVQTNDFAATTTGLTLNVQDTIESVPIPRSQTGLILLAPGTTAGDTGFADCADCVSIGGATIAENSYYVNGLNTTNFRTLVGNNTVPFEFYRTFDIKTGGYSAEFGRALGGVTSAVVKSGSNNLEAGAVVTFAPDFLASTVPNTFQNAAGLLKQKNDDDYRQSVQANFYLSGALIKDSLH
jgi:Carboxypeptidase regulatory-like domain/TonB-dependent Receptor Plug Domain